MKDLRCYWCGENASSREHVPPRSFFDKGKRDGLITVPACQAHNQELGKLDEKFRLFFQLTAGAGSANSGLRDIALRGWRRPEAARFRTALVNSMVRATLNGEETMALLVNSTEMDHFAEKILRGLYFHQYSEVFTGTISSVCTHIHSESIDIKEVIADFSEFRGDLIQGNASNPQVFRYECGRVVDDGLPVFAMICTFYENVTIFGLGLSE